MTKIHFFAKQIKETGSSNEVVRGQFFIKEKVSFTSTD